MQLGGFLKTIQEAFKEELIVIPNQQLISLAEKGKAKSIEFLKDKIKEEYKEKNINVYYSNYETEIHFSFGFPLEENHKHWYLDIINGEFYKMTGECYSEIIEAKNNKTIQQLLRII